MGLTVESYPEPCRKNIQICIQSRKCRIYTV